jgi:hypothetical protein
MTIGVLVQAQLLQLVEQLADHGVVLDHAVGVDAQAGLALGLLLEVRPDVHAGGVPPQEERLALALRVGHEAHGLAGELLVHRLHALDVERPGQLDLLLAVGQRPGVEHTAGAVLLAHLRILEIVRMLRLLLGVQVIERAVELVETVRRGQVLVAIAEVVLAELAGLVAPGLEQLGDRDVAGLQALPRTRQPHLEHAGAEAGLAGDEACAPGGAALLPVPVGEQRTLARDAVDVRRPVAHHALVVRAHVPVADVVAPEDEDVRLLRGVLRVRRPGDGDQREREQRQQDASKHAASAVVPSGVGEPAGVPRSHLSLSSRARQRSIAARAPATTP